MLRHAVVKGAQLNETDAKRVLQHLADLWSYHVSLVETDASDAVIKEYVLGAARGRRGCLKAGLGGAPAPFGAAIASSRHLARRG